jgi:hypothetical protein
MHSEEIHSSVFPRKESRMNSFVKRLLLFATWGACCLSPLKALSQDAMNEEIIAGTDSVTTWLLTNSHGRPATLGASIPAAMLQDLPDHHMEVSVAFPRRPHLPFTHLYLMWEPQGHEPVGIYDVPHFDVHFYLLSDQVRRQITCAGEDEARCLKKPLPSAIPSDYAPTPAGVPQMGWHWLDTLAPEFHGHPFTATMVYGYYEGRLAFLEPMITKAFLETKPHIQAKIRQPETFPEAGYYPTKYQVLYRYVPDTYDIAITDFRYRH